MELHEMSPDSLRGEGVDIGGSADRRHLIVTLQLPDRPGALGAVASRIGAVGADITDVRVSSRRPGVAEDVFHLELPVIEGVDTVGLLLDEIHQVDGVLAPSLSYPPPGCCA